MSRSGATYAVAMSQEDGCLVMVENDRHVVGSMTREQTIAFAQGCLDWTAYQPPTVAETAVAKTVRTAQVLELGRKLKRAPADGDAA